MHGDAQRLALDVPEGLLHTADRCDVMARAQMLNLTNLPDESLHVEGVQADHQRLETLQGLLNDPRRAHGGGLPEAGNPCVGLDTDKGPVPAHWVHVYVQGIQASDLYDFALTWYRSARPHLSRHHMLGGKMTPEASRPPVAR